MAKAGMNTKKMVSKSNMVNRSTSGGKKTVSGLPSAQGRGGNAVNPGMVIKGKDLGKG